MTIPPIPALVRLVAQGIANVTVAIVGLTLMRSPAVGPAAPATPPPLTGRFDSTLNGISVDVAAGWVVAVRDRRPLTRVAEAVVIDPSRGRR